jgi:hypothetical protein
MLTRLRIVVRGLATNWVGILGISLTTSAFVLFIFFELLRITEIITNAYIGLISYMSLPAVFVLGLFLIPLGWWKYRRQTKKTTKQLLQERFEPDFIQARPLGSKLVTTIVGLTLLNLLFLGAGGIRMLHFMEQPKFCGTACHSVMSPEWTTYQLSPHARVKCVDCHVGEGWEAELDAKLNGLWQMVSVSFDLYPRPIPTPVHNLRPARETCEKCHWPEVFYGERIKRLVRYASDYNSTPEYTTLSLKVGSGRGEKRGQIHWHVAKQNRVQYHAADEKRNAMLWVDVLQPDGEYKRYTNKNLAVDSQPNSRVRILDCVDCHNRATHIYEDPQEAIDFKIAAGQIDTSLPFTKRQALAALTGSYPEGQAELYIARGIQGFYQHNHPQEFAKNQDTLEKNIEALQEIYARNIHERMKVGWNVYPNHLGHRRNLGCRRCHHPDMVDQQGRAIPNQCTLCHSILAYQSDRPFQYLMSSDPKDPECKMQLYLKSEFLGEDFGEESCGPQDNR